MPGEITLLREKVKEKSQINHFKIQQQAYDVSHVSGQRETVFAGGVPYRCSLTFKSQGRPGA